MLLICYFNIVVLKPTIIPLTNQSSMLITKAMRFIFYELKELNVTSKTVSFHTYASFLPLHIIVFMTTYEKNLSNQWID